ncbi:hypothetical protein QBC43DRAFT_320776 [Cladorrhinum sp. PSN259]|nr:hypothetical protein QBC43DRAFT_320776 [Cladorrhinum sp. PSN259]
MNPRPGIVLVRSCISSPDLAPEAFHKWYEEAHIPYLLSTPGVKTATRYKSASQEALPYLAVYHLHDLEWLRRDTCEFWKGPLHSDIFPNDTQMVFTWAQFETGFYEKIDTSDDGRLSGNDDHGAEGNALFVVQWERLLGYSADHAEDIFSIARQKLSDLGVKGEPRLRLYKADGTGLSPPGVPRDQPLMEGTKYLCLADFKHPEVKEEGKRDIDLMFKGGTTEYHLISSHQA